VGVIDDSMPYSDVQPKIDGIAVDIWRYVANKHGLKYKFVSLPNRYDDALRGLEAGRYDVLLGGIGVISRRYDWALYTRPYYVASINLYRRQKGDFLSHFFNRNMIYFTLLTLALLLIYTGIYHNYQGVSYLRSLYSTFVNFVVASDVLLDESLRNISQNRLMSINSVWVFVRWLFFTVVVVNAISSIVESKNVISESEVQGVTHVNIVGDSALSDYVKSIGRTAVDNPSTTEIHRKLQQSRDTQYWLEDDNIVQAAISKYGDLSLASTTTPLRREEFAIAVSRRQPQLVEMLNRTIVELQDNGQMLKICRGYLTRNLDGCQM